MVGVGNSNACVRARERENFVVIDLLMDKYNVAFFFQYIEMSVLCIMLYTHHIKKKKKRGVRRTNNKHNSTYS